MSKLSAAQRLARRVAGLLDDAPAAAPQAPAIAKGLTGPDVMAEAAKGGKKLSFADWRKANEGQLGDMFDIKNAQPAMPNRPELPRFEPPRGASARISDAINDKKVQKGLKAAVQRGMEIMPEPWYRTGPLFDVYQQELGANAPQAYERMMQIMAATSPRSRVPDNIRTGSYFNYLDAQGMPLPDKPAAGYGSVAQNLHLQNVGAIRQTGGMDPLRNPKPATFVENLLGNEKQVTVDTHNFRLPGMLAKDPRFLATSVRETVIGPDGKEMYVDMKPRQMFESGDLTMKDALKRPSLWESAPNANEYKAYEDVQKRLAAEMGLTPAQWQEKMWVGGGDVTGLDSPPEPFLRTLEARIKYTADRLGADPQEILRKFVKGEIPLLSVTGGAVVGGGLLADQPAEAGQ